MATFKIAYQSTLTAEGLYDNDSVDKGGETFRGLTRTADTDWDGWLLVDSYKGHPDFPHCLYDNTVLQQKVERYYKKKYWDVLHLDDLKSERMGREIYDTGVNLGIQTAAKFFQRILNVLNRQGILYRDLPVDGHVGPKTIAAFNSLKEEDKRFVYILFNALQGSRYISICENNPTQEKFIRGWATRVFES